jgi:hypothetical protein
MAGVEGQESSTVPNMSREEWIEAFEIIVNAAAHSLMVSSNYFDAKVDDELLALTPIPMKSFAVAVFLKVRFIN